MAMAHKFNIDTYQGQYDYHTQYPDDWYCIYPTNLWELKDYKELFEAIDGGTLIFDDGIGDVGGWVINPDIQPEELSYIDEQSGEKYMIDVMDNTTEKAIGYVEELCAYGVFNIECIGRPYLLAEFDDQEDAQKFYIEETN